MLKSPYISLIKVIKDDEITIEQFLLDLHKQIEDDIKGKNKLNIPLEWSRNEKNTQELKLKVSINHYQVIESYFKSQKVNTNKLPMIGSDCYLTINIAELNKIDLPNSNLSKKEIETDNDNRLLTEEYQYQCISTKSLSKQKEAIAIVDLDNKWLALQTNNTLEQKACALINAMRQKYSNCCLPILIDLHPHSTIFERYTPTQKIKDCLAIIKTGSPSNISSALSKDDYKLFIEILRNCLPQLDLKELKKIFVDDITEIFGNKITYKDYSQEVGTLWEKYTKNQWPQDLNLMQLIHFVRHLRNKNYSADNAEINEKILQTLYTERKDYAQVFVDHLIKLNLLEDIQTKGLALLETLVQLEKKDIILKLFTIENIIELTQSEESIHLATQAIYYCLPSIVENQDTIVLDKINVAIIENLIKEAVIKNDDKIAKFLLSHTKNENIESLFDPGAQIKNYSRVMYFSGETQHTNKKVNDTSIRALLFKQAINTHLKESKNLEKLLTLKCQFFSRAETDKEKDLLTSIMKYYILKNFLIYKNHPSETELEILNTFVDNPFSTILSHIASSQSKDFYKQIKADPDNSYHKTMLKIQKKMLHERTMSFYKLKQAPDEKKKPVLSYKG